MKMVVANPDTIAAVATPPGRGGVGIVRVSGALAPDIAREMFGKLPGARVATFGVFRDAQGNALDQGLALYFPAPHSFTGENVLELHGHGGPVVLDALLARVLECGARLARPGEFSERAFLNGKLDLAQAEAVADLIEAGSGEAARAALRSLEGEFSRRVRTIVDALVQLRMHVEAALDFPEEELDFLVDVRILSGLDRLATDMEGLAADAQQGVLLHDGMTVVIAGPPNAGKSSLLNALARSDAAIVSPIPGTTRDVLRERIHIDGMPLHVVDTAGLRDSTNAIEAEGVRRARAQMQRADLVLFVTDDADSDSAAVQIASQHVPGELPLLHVRNKIDLSGRAAGQTETATGVEIALSAVTGAGLDALRDHLKQRMGYRSGNAGLFSARRRHLDALSRARAAVEQGHARLSETRAGELLAEELRVAQNALGEITGEFTADDLLGRIFSEFCIGK